MRHLVSAGRRVGRWAASMLLSAALMAAQWGGMAAPALAEISPVSLEVSLRPGESVTEVKTVTVPRIIPKADILFALDLTGSMGGVLSTAKARAIDIMTDLDDLISDAQYGVVSHMDYPAFYSSYGYSSTYGTLSCGDYPYRLNQSITANRAAVAAAINGLNLGCGADGPESYTRVLYEAYADAGIGWREGSRRILILFGDNIPHDNNLNEGISGGVWSTGGDPGRDGVILNGDDLDLQLVLSSMQANGVILMAVWSWDIYLNYWQHWAEITGGEAVMLDATGNLPATIRDLIEGSAAQVKHLSLQVSPGFESWVSVTPARYTNLSTPTTVAFDLTITVPAGTAPGDYAFTVTAIGDGASFGEQRVLVHVRPLDENPPVTSLNLNGLMGLDGWWRSDVVATLSATDDLSGVAATYYSLDGSAEAVYTAPFSISGDGAHTVTYYSVDNAGNIEPLKAARLRIDATPPRVDLSLAGTAGLNGWYVSPVTATVTARDATSGVADSFFDVFYVIDGPDGWSVYSGPVGIGDEGEQAVHAYAADAAGNRSGVAEAPVNIDLTPPVIRITDLNGEYMQGEAVTIEYSARDRVSGLDAVAGRLNGEPVASGTTMVLGPGRYELEVVAQDVAGHSSRSVRYFQVNAAATVHAHPRTLNLASAGETLTVHVDLPAPYSPAEIDCATVLLNAQVPADCSHPGDGDAAGRGHGRLFVFDRQYVESIASPGDFEVVVTGSLFDGTPYKGSDTIRVIRRGR